MTVSRKTCPRCKLRSANSRDHIVPVVLGKMCDKYGIEFDWDGDDNVEMVCDVCNTKRGHKLITEQAREIRNTILDKFIKGEIYVTGMDMYILKRM